MNKTIQLVIGLRRVKLETEGLPTELADALVAAQTAALAWEGLLNYELKARGLPTPEERVALQAAKAEEDVRKLAAEKIPEAMREQFIADNLVKIVARTDIQLATIASATQKRKAETDLKRGELDRG